MKTKLFLLLSILSISSIASAQFEIQGIIRPRFEVRNGYATLRNDTTTPAAFVSQRSRLNFSYKKDKLQTKLSLFDFRVWGDQIWKKDIPSFGVHEVWAKYNINDAWSIKFGRQEMKYDNSRLISAVNWNQIGAAHDALFIKYKKNSWKVDFAIAWNQSAQNIFGTDYANADSFYKSLNIFFLQKDFKNFKISTLNILDGNQDFINPEDICFRLTSGIKLDFKKDKIQAIVRVFGQRGEFATRQELKTFYTNIELSYKLSDKLNLTFGNEIKSGNDAKDSLNTTSNAFDIIYGARHKLNGRIGYFSTPASTKGAGLIDSYLKSDYKLSKSTKFSVEYHYFMLQNNYIHNSVVIDKFLAHEFDFIFNKKVSESVKLEAGYSMIFGSESLEIIKGGNTKLFNNWFYLMITIDPTIFKSNNN